MKVQGGGQCCFTLLHRVWAPALGGLEDLGSTTQTSKSTMSEMPSLKAWGDPQGSPSQQVKVGRVAAGQQDPLHSPAEGSYPQPRVTKAMAQLQEPACLGGFSW